MCVPSTPWTSSSVLCPLTLAECVPFQSAWVPSPWTGALDEVMHCHMCSQVRGWTVWLHWAAQMGSVESLCRLGVPVLCLVCVTQCALGCSGLLCQRKARPSVHMEDDGDLSGRDWQD